MQIRIKIIFRLLKEAFREWQQDKVSLLAAALAYYTVFSITPLLVIAIAIAPEQKLNQQSMPNQLSNK